MSTALSILLSFTDYATLVIDHSTLYFSYCCQIWALASHLEPEGYVHLAVQFRGKYLFDFRL